MSLSRGTPAPSHARRRQATTLSTAMRVAAAELLMIWRSWQVRTAIPVAFLAGTGLILAALTMSPAGLARTSAYAWMATGVLCTTTVAAAITGVWVAHRSRVDGTLEVIQSAPTNGLGIALGQILAAAVVGAAYPLAAIPFLVVCVILGEGFASAALIVVLCVFVSVCSAAAAVGLGHLPRRPLFGITTGLLLGVLLLGAGPAAYQMLLPTQHTTARSNVYWQERPGAPCAYRLNLRQVTFSNHIWWLNMFSPLVTVADATSDAPDSPGPLTQADPLARIQRDLRVARTGPPQVLDECADGRDDTPPPMRDSSWPYGLLALSCLGAAGLTTAAFRVESSHD